MKAKRIISLFLLASLLISASACGSEAPEKESTDTTAGETTEKPEYEFPELDCGGDKFTILNTGWVWSMYTFIDFETQTGDSLDDAVYERNRKVEERYNITITETPSSNAQSDYLKSIQAGDNSFDIALLRMEWALPVVLQSAAVNWADIPHTEINFPSVQTPQNML